MTAADTSGSDRRRRGIDRGSISIVALGVVAVLAGLLLVTARLGRDAFDAARARTAADAAALAGALGGRSSASEFARANGGELVRFTAIGDDVIVDVTVGNATESARATSAP